LIIPVYFFLNNFNSPKKFGYPINIKNLFRGKSAENPPKKNKISFGFGV